MIRALLVAALVLASCKKYETRAAIGEPCKSDDDCSEGLDCRAWEDGKAMCSKSCGMTKAQALRPRDETDKIDTSCPPGWECRATEERLVDRDGSDRGAAFSGLNDQPMCMRVK